MRGATIKIKIITGNGLCFVVLLAKTWCRLSGNWKGVQKMVADSVLHFVVYYLSQRKWVQSSQ
jgi:hypothetical protein